MLAVVAGTFGIAISWELEGAECTEWVLAGSTVFCKTALSADNNLRQHRKIVSEERVSA